MRSITLKITMLAIILIAFVSVSIVNEVQAMPNFARKYSLGCTSCHSVVPRLNEFGWKFRAAGYRLPEEIGKNQPTFNLGDYVAGRLNIAYTDQSVTAASPGSSSVNNTNIQFAGASLYPIFGALTKNISSEMEISFNPPSPPNNGTSGLTFPVSISTASIGYYAGSEDAWFSVRTGILNEIQGYGASDRGISSGSALMGSAYPVSLPAIAAGDKIVPGYTGLGGSNMGIDLGYVWHESAIHAELLSGYAYDVKDKPFTALGGGAPKPTGLAPSANSLDWMIFANQILTDNGGGVSAVYYHGQADINTNTAIKTTNNDSLFWTDKYSRWAIYASYPIEKALLLGGYENGLDNSWTLQSFAYAQDVKSHGWFAEADYDITDLVGIGARYDLVNPNTAADNNKISQVTGFVNYNFGDGLQLIGQYSAKSTDTPSNGTDLLGTAKNNVFVIRISWIQ
jgi:hypothetical protein